jgi:hypothetical protein
MNSELTSGLFSSAVDALYNMLTSWALAKMAMQMFGRRAFSPDYSKPPFWCITL